MLGSSLSFGEIAFLRSNTSQGWQFWPRCCFARPTRLITLFDGPSTHSFIYPDQNGPSSHQLLRSRSAS